MDQLGPQRMNVWDNQKLTPVHLHSDVYEVTHALEQVRRRANLKATELRLLTYVVAETLANRGKYLTQRTIAEDVFGRNLESFDGHENSIVRTTASKLRKVLFDYYTGPGQSDPVMIELPRGTYVPTFVPRPRVSLKARSSILLARHEIEERTVSSLDSAIGHLDSVLAEDPSQSLALALKAEALATQAIHGARPRPKLEAARALASRALDQPNPAWQAWLSSGLVKQSLDWDWTAAGASYGKAIESAGEEAATNPWYAAYLGGLGRSGEAVLHLQREVDRFGYGNRRCMGDLSMLKILSRDYVGAQTVIETALKLAPDYYQHHLHHAILLEAMGDPAAALRVLEKTPLKLLERPVTWGLQGLFSGLTGDRDVARRRETWLQVVAKTGKYVPHTQIAACQIGTGEHDEAVRSLETAADDRDPLTVWFYAYPMTRHLQGHPGFQKLIDRIGIRRY